MIDQQNKQPSGEVQQEVEGWDTHSPNHAGVVIIVVIVIVIVVANYRRHYYHR